MSSTDVSDGRSARAARTKAAVVEALLELIEEGDLRPTARRVAQRAGISLRSVYVHFDDLEDLFCAAAQRQIERVVDVAGGPVPAEGSLTARADAVARQRLAIFETGGRVRRAAALQEPFSPTLQRLARDISRTEREDLARVFATELAPLDPPVRAARVALLHVLTGAAAWDTLRAEHGLDPERGRAEVAAAIVAVLETEA